LLEYHAECAEIKELLQNQQWYRCTTTVQK
jgi:hypothetical protein